MLLLLRSTTRYRARLICTPLEANAWTREGRRAMSDEIVLNIAIIVTIHLFGVILNKNCFVSLTLYGFSISEKDVHGE